MSFVQIRQKVGSFDFSTTRARLVASVPGAHTGESRHRWGLGKLRKLLQDHFAQRPPLQDPIFPFAISSIGSLGKPDRWMTTDFAAALNPRAPLGQSTFVGRGNNHSTAGAV